jgi:allantoicase
MNEIGIRDSMAREVTAIRLTPSSALNCGLQVISVPSSPSTAQHGNQGTALVVRKLTSFPSSYDCAPSGKSSSCNTAYFQCAPRPVFNSKGKTRLEIKVFERHPYTRQAFFPMGTDARRRAYVVVVADDKGNTIAEPY